MPSLFIIGGYRVFFWSNENNEPVHVHVCKGNPSPNATKVWLTARGGCLVAHNKSRIPNHDLNQMLELIAVQSSRICKEWRIHFKLDTVQFYC